MEIMIALGDQPELRAAVLEPTVGTRRKIALRKTPESSAMDLQLALDENETEPAIIVEHFGADEQVRYLDAELLWGYIVDPGFWTRAKGDEGYDAARLHLTRILEVALAEELLLPLEVVTGISYEELMTHLPNEKRAALLEVALRAGRGGKAFTDADVLDTIPVAELTEHVPLELIWSAVIEPTLAFGDKPAKASKPAKVEAKADKNKNGKADKAAKSGQPAKVAQAPKIAAAPKVAQADEAEEAIPDLIEIDDSDLFDSDLLVTEMDEEFMVEV